MQKTTAKNSGFTLVEALIASAILSALIAATFQILITAQNHQASAAIRDNLRSQAEKALNDIIDEFQNINEECIYDPVLSNANAPAQDRVEFSRVTSVDEFGARSYSTERYVIQFEYANGETDNGVDDNTNGLIDEGSIVMRELTSGKLMKTIAINVMENYDHDSNSGTANIPGFSISFEVDDPANPTRWLVRVSIALEKFNPAKITTGTTRGTIIVYYKTATIALAK